MPLAQLLRRTIFILIILLLIGYALFNARFLLTGPQLTNITPLNGSTLDTPNITIQGQASRISEITLNDRPIFIDENNSFSEKLLLQPGLSIIKVHAKDRFGRETQQILEYVY